MNVSGAAVNILSNIPQNQPVPVLPVVVTTSTPACPAAAMDTSKFSEFHVIDGKCYAYVSNEVCEQIILKFGPKKNETRS